MFFKKYIHLSNGLHLVPLMWWEAWACQTSVCGSGTRQWPVPHDLGNWGQWPPSKEGVLAAPPAVAALNGFSPGTGGQAGDVGGTLGDCGHRGDRKYICRIWRPSAACVSRPGAPDMSVPVGEAPHTHPLPHCSRPRDRPGQVTELLAGDPRAFNSSMMVRGSCEARPSCSLPPVAATNPPLHPHHLHVTRNERGSSSKGPRHGRFWAPGERSCRFRGKSVGRRAPRWQQAEEERGSLASG